MAARNDKGRAHGRAESNELIASLQSFALGFPGSWHDAPWGDSVIKVGAKIFVFLGDPEHPTITVKVPESHDHAMSFAGAMPTGYGLGKAGWVTIPVDGLDSDEAEVLQDFIEESYRIIAPKKMISELDAYDADPDGER